MCRYPLNNKDTKMFILADSHRSDRRGTGRLRNVVGSKNSADPKTPRIAALPASCAALISAEPDRSSTPDSRYRTQDQHSADEMTSR